jgi:6-phosphofructokinase 2
MKKHKIITITISPAIDINTNVSKVIPEHKLRCTETVYEAGGGGINVSKAIKKLGGDSLAIMQSGGSTGEMLEQLMANMSIDFLAIKTKNPTRQNFIVLEENTNAQYRFGMPGSTLSTAEIDEFIQKIEQLSVSTDFIVASGSLPEGVPVDFYARIAKICKENNTKFILDTSGAPLKAAANEGVYLLKPNLQELSQLYNVENLELNDVDDAAKFIIEKGNCEVVVVSLGPQGAILVTKDGYEHAPSPIVKKLSTVGAGDSMVAGMVWALSEGKSLSEMLRMGVACGSAATMNKGSQLFKKSDVDKLYDWINKNADKFKINFEGKTIF